MAHAPAWLQEFADADEAPVLAHRKVAEDAEMDITPMIDCTFLLLIFFVVCSTTSQQDKVTLPKAHHGVGVSQESTIVLTLASGGESGKAEIYLGDDTSSAPVLGDAAQQETQVRNYVEEGVRGGRTNILVKAERTVQYRDISRICTAATVSEGITLYLAVAESDS